MTKSELLDLFQIGASLSVSDKFHIHTASGRLLEVSAETVLAYLRRSSTSFTIDSEGNVIIDGVPTGYKIEPVDLTNLTSRVASLESSMSNTIEEAPDDGKQYVRKNKAWVENQSGSLSAEEKDALASLVDDKYPLTLTISGNGGIKERGTSVVPSATLTVKRGSTDVTSSSTMTASSGTLTGSSFSDTAITSAKTYTFTATYNGKTKTANISYSFLNYRYRGMLSTLPGTDEQVLSAIQSASKEFSESAILGATNLSANKYYIFAVVGTHSFEIRENSTNGVVSAAKTGTISVPRVNATANDTYSYIIVPASDMAWTFKIV